MKNLTIIFCFLLAYTITTINARPSIELATRLSNLYMDPANDESFNEINRFDIDEVYYSKRKEVMKEPDLVLSTKEVSTKRPEEVEDTTSSAETEERLMRFMFGLMGNVMRRFIPL
uniref:Uncharacterized protein n=1 Tax=Ceratitis capitata TaxID=7213 RepID=W8B4W8_CERCA